MTIQDVSESLPVSTVLCAVLGIVVLLVEIYAARLAMTKTFRVCTPSSSHSHEFQRSKLYAK